MQWPKAVAVWAKNPQTQSLARYLCTGAFNKQDEIIAHKLRPEVAVKNVIYFPVRMRQFWLSFTEYYQCAGRYTND